MEQLDARKTIIAWTPNSDAIEAAHLLQDGDNDWTRAYEMTSCAAHIWLRSATDEIISSFLKSEFIAATFRDGVCPRAAYHEFMRVRQFRDCVPQDMPVDPVLFYTSWEPFEDSCDPEPKIDLLQGLIEVGQKFIWEPNLPHAYCRLIVTGITKDRWGDGIIWSRDLDKRDAKPTWNNESRFREACVRA